MNVFLRNLYYSFINPKIGQTHRSKVFCMSCIPQNATPIMPEEDQVNNHGDK